MPFHCHQRNIRNLLPNLKINSVSIERVTEFNFLDVAIDEILNWNAHTKKKMIVSKTLGTMNRLKLFLPLTVMCILYTTLILPHWGRVTHICIGNLTIIAPDNGLSPGRRQAIIWTNAGILLIGPLGTNFSEISIGIQVFSFKKMHLNMSSVKWLPFCLGLNVLSHLQYALLTWGLKPNRLIKL